MAQSTKKPWTKPEVRCFRTPEELLAPNGPKGSDIEQEEFEVLLRQWVVADRNPEAQNESDLSWPPKLSSGEP